MSAVQAVYSGVRPFAKATRLAAVTAAGLSAAAVVIGVAPSAAAVGCSDVDVVFARGTNEPTGIGRVGQAFVDALRGQVGYRSVTTYAVNYPATYDFAAAAEGATDATTHVVTMAQACPGTRIVLGGFSQGAAVVDMLAGIPPLGDKLGSIANPLPGSVAGNVAAVAVFGNPATKFGNPVSASRLFGGRAIDLCTNGDPICSKGRNPFAHSNYVQDGLTNQAASFVAARV